MGHQGALAAGRGGEGKTANQAGGLGPDFVCRQVGENERLGGYQHVTIFNRAPPSSGEAGVYEKKAASRNVPDSSSGTAHRGWASGGAGTVP